MYEKLFSVSDNTIKANLIPSWPAVRTHTSRNKRARGWKLYDILTSLGHGITGKGLGTIQGSRAAFAAGWRKLTVVIVQT